MWPYNIQNNAQWIYVFGKNHTPKNINISYAIFENQSMRLKLNSPIEPDHCPSKWIDKGYNEFEFELLLDQVNSITINEFNFSGPICISIKKNKTDHEIHLNTLDKCITKCTARGVYISNIKAYHNDYSE